MIPGDWLARSQQSVINEEVQITDAFFDQKINSIYKE